MNNLNCTPCKSDTLHITRDTRNKTFLSKYPDAQRRAPFLNESQSHVEKYDCISEKKGPDDEVFRL